jgi:hypothetical protein
LVENARRRTVVTTTLEQETASDDEEEQEECTQDGSNSDTSDLTFGETRVVGIEAVAVRRHRCCGTSRGSDSDGLKRSSRHDRKDNTLASGGSVGEYAARISRVRRAGGAVRAQAPQVGVEAAIARFVDHGLNAGSCQRVRGKSAIGEVCSDLCESIRACIAADITCHDALFALGPGCARVGAERSCRYSAKSTCGNRILDDGIAKEGCGISCIVCGSITQLNVRTAY